MGALSTLVLKSKDLLNKESGKAVAKRLLKDNSVLTELDISDNYYMFNKYSLDGVGFAHQAFAVGFVDNGALSLAYV
jgi:hypothetical protein